jgi:hypothetical protein
MRQTIADRWVKVVAYASVHDDERQGSGPRSPLQSVEPRLFQVPVIASVLIQVMVFIHVTEECLLKRLRHFQTSPLRHRLAQLAWFEHERELFDANVNAKNISLI